MSARGIDRDVLLQDPPRAADALRAAKRLVEEVPSPRGSGLLLIGMTLGEVAAQVVVALAARSLLVAVGRGDPVPSLPFVVAMLAALVSFLVVRARHRLQERLAVACRERAVRRLAGHLHRADVQDLSATPMAGLREILMTDVDFAYRFLLESVGQLTVVLAWTVAALALTAWLSPLLLIVLLVLGLVVALGMLRVTRRHLALTGERFPKLAAVSQRARDVVEVERVVVARQFGLRDLFVRQFLTAHEAFIKVAHAQGRVTASVRASITSLGSIAFLAVVLVGSVLVAREGLAVGSLVAVLFILGQLVAALAALGDYAGRLAETATAGTRLLAFWDDPAPEPPPVPRHDDDRVLALTASGVGFGYAGGPPVLAGVDVTLRHGRLGALTAATGAGKSTLALLLTGVLHPDTGAVLATDGTGASLSPERLHAGRVLHVPAKPVLVPGSILDNLLLDDEAFDVDEIAGFVHWVTAGALTHPVDEPVIGPNGTGLSSGQAQLMQLARAVHRDPDVLVLDEATSALDMETEARVQRALLDWCAERVCLVVSHRTCPWTEAAVDRLHLVPVTSPAGALTVELTAVSDAVPA